VRILPAIRVMLILMLLAVFGYGQEGTRELPDWMAVQRSRYVRSRHLSKAYQTFDQGQYVETRRLLEELLELDPGNREALELLVHVHHHLEEWDAGVAICARILAADENALPLWLTKGYMAQAAGRQEVALEAFDEVVARAAPGAPQVRLAREALRQLYFDRAAYDKAEAQAEALVAENDSVELRRFLAECATRQGMTEHALEHLAAAIQLPGFGPEHEAYLDVMLAAGYAAQEAGEFDRAAEAFTKGLAAMPKGDSRRERVIWDTADTLFKGGHIDRAMRFVSTSGAWDRYRVSLFLAECSQRQGDLKAVVAHLTAAVALSDGEGQKAELMRRQGDLYAEMADYVAASRNFKAYLETTFDEGVALSLVRAYVAAGQHQKATEACDRFLVREGLSAAFRTAVLTELLYAQHALGRYAAAYGVAVELIKLSKDHRFIHAAAQNARLGGMLDRAAKLYKASLEKRFDPEVAMDYHYVQKARGLDDDSIILLKRVIGAGDADAQLRNHALYELTQVFRRLGRTEEYAKCIEALQGREENPAFLVEYGDYLYDKDHYALARDAYQRSLVGNTNAAMCFAVAQRVAGLSLLLGEPEAAAEWLDRAREWGTPDRDWHLRWAQVDYQRGAYQAAVDRLQSRGGKDVIVNLMLGFSFSKMDMPGLALHYLMQVEHPEALTIEQRIDLYSNRAYLNYEQGLYAVALDDANMALRDTGPNHIDLRVVALRAMVGMGLYEDAMQQADALLEESTMAAIEGKVWNGVVATDDGQPAVPELSLAEDDQAALCAIIGHCAFALEDYPLALKAFTTSISYAREVNVLYMQGLTYAQLERYEESEATLQEFRDSVADVPHTYWADMGIVKGKRDAFDEGLALLNRSLSVMPYDIRTREEAGYQAMKQCANREAKMHFMGAAALYGELLPYVDEPERVPYEGQRRAMLQEHAKLDKAIGMSLYMNRTDYDFEALSAPLSFTSIEGALPSQAGVMVSWRPPYIGFRRERTAELFGRLLANFQPHSSEFEKESYQAGVGVQVKPFRSANLMASLEQLFAIGDHAEDNWLFRARGSHDWGADVRSGDRMILQATVFGEAGAFLAEPSRTYVYVSGKAGPAWGLSRALRVTLPEVVVLSRSETEDDAHERSYSQVGIGLSVGLKGREKGRTSQQWLCRGYAHYVYGWFMDTPDTLDDNAFEGVVFGVSIVR
jgi:tetratricopeptide (TPR) repeat protein